MRIVWTILGIYAAGVAGSAIAMMQGCSNLRMDVVATGPAAMSPTGCAECHGMIHDEWSGSPHARAFSNATFQAELSAHAQGECVSCHAPQSILTDGPLLARETRREQGVNCQSCHMTEDCAMAGPNPAFDLHPVQPRQAFYRTSAMCGRCHEETYREWQSAPPPEAKLLLVDRGGDAVQASDMTPFTPPSELTKQTCQECHMQPVTRRQTDHPPFDKLHPAYEGRTHIFSATHGELLDGAIELELAAASADEAGLHLAVAATNAKALHNVPTGAFGHRQVDIVAELTDAAGRAVAEARHPLLADLRTALAPGERREIELTLRPASPGQRIRLRAERVDAAGQAVATLGRGDGMLAGRVDRDDFIRYAAAWSRPIEQTEAPPPDRAPAVRLRYRDDSPGPLARVADDLRWGWARLRAAVAGHPDAIITVVAIGLAVLYLRRLIHRGRAT